MRSAGGNWPSCLASSGLLSNSSRWLGPPAMNRKMTRFALAAKCGCRGASGSCGVRGGRRIEQIGEANRTEADAALAAGTSGGWRESRRLGGAW